MMIHTLAAQFLRFITPMIVNGVYGGFWQFRRTKVEKIQQGGIFRRVYFYYQERFGCYIGENAVIASCPVFPHNMYGIFISNMSKIGKNAVIFQQVTIGSNTIEGHPRSGSPVIGDNVYIGAGAKIIGNVTIGDNCRIGANCVVVKDMPPNTTAVAASTRFIESDHVLENRFVSADEYLKK